MLRSIVSPVDFTSSSGYDHNYVIADYPGAILHKYPPLSHVSYSSTISLNLNLILILSDPNSSLYLYHHLFRSRPGLGFALGSSYFTHIRSRPAGFRPSPSIILCSFHVPLKTLKNLIALGKFLLSGSEV